MILTLSLKDYYFFKEDLDKELDIVLGEIGVDLVGDDDQVRRHETNLGILKGEYYIVLLLIFLILLGDFICDIILASVKGDCCILNSGSLRSNRTHPKGEFKIKDLKAILPFPSDLVIISVTGKHSKTNN